MASPWEVNLCIYVNFPNLEMRSIILTGQRVEWKGWLAFLDGKFQTEGSQGKRASYPQFGLKFRIARLIVKGVTSDLLLISIK